MSYINCKYLWVVVLMAVFVITGTEIRTGHPQTNLQAIEDRVAELERKLAGAKARQEKAQTVRMQLEEQEQKLAGLEKYLSESDKYRVESLNIRMNIKSIRTKIEAITIEENGLEQDLKIAKNLQSILRETQTTVRPKTRIMADQSTVEFADKTNKWQIRNIYFDKNLSNDENSEIASFFIIGHQIDQDEILNSAYQIYNRTGVIINIVVHYNSENAADLDIILNQRASMNSKTLQQSMQLINFNEFKLNYFSLALKRE